MDCSTKKRYRNLTEQLRRAGFTQDTNESKQPTRQRWKINEPNKVSVEFLIQPSLKIDRGGKLRNIEADFAAVISPGLHLAFQDREQIRLSGKTIMGEEATRNIWVCGPGAYLILKALAFRNRGENKDAYDLFYVIRNFRTGLDGILNRLRPLLTDQVAQEAIEVLREDFEKHDGVGPRRVAEFITGTADSGIQADVVGFISKLLQKIDGLS